MCFFLSPLGCMLLLLVVVFVNTLMSHCWGHSGLLHFFFPCLFLDPEQWDTLWYRTGDLARYLPDGTLELFGRADSQVPFKLLQTRVCTFLMLIMLTLSRSYTAFCYAPLP